MIEPENREKHWCLVILKFMSFYWRGIFLIVWPFISALTFLISFEKKIRCLFIVVLMAGYWVTEVVPLGVTGMMPIFLLPLLDVQDTGVVCLNYLNKANVIFMASVMIAIGIEHCGLHNRIAYATLICLGCSPRRLHFGLSLVTALLSMWLINAACTAMMCPIITAVLTELEGQGIGSMYKPKDPDDPEDERPRPTDITIAYFLTAAYASTIGGIGSIVGTGTNLTYKGIYETRFPDGNTIDFVPWLLFNVPPMLLITGFCWLSLEWIFMGLWRPNSAVSQVIREGNENVETAYKVMRTKRSELEKMTWNEVGVLILFLLCIISWILRKPQVFPGWGVLYETDIADATPAVTVIFFFSAIPASFAFFLFCTRDKTARPPYISSPLVPWSVVQAKMPWQLVFLLGGGFALADAGKKSGMSAYLGDKLAVMSSLPPFLVLCITNFLASLVTELTSNAAICNIVSPIFIEMSIAMGVHPMSFTFPAAVMCSFAFLMPVGTPTNAIVVQHVNMRTSDMVKGGVLLKIFAWAVYMVLYPTYGTVFYDQKTLPEWAKLNKTAGT